jgi:N-acetylmuramoyl-L-alanine amidase
MKFAIDAGHNCQCDRGAIGIGKSEDMLTLDLAEKLIKLLEAEGHECILVTPKQATSTSDSLQQRVNLANKAKVDLYVSLHFNALNNRAYGSEVYATSLEGQKIAEKVLQEIVKLGFYNRGVKNRNFFVIKNTNMPAILVECCFCDSKRDMDDYDPIAMAIAIKNGLVGKSGSYESVKKKNYLKVNRLVTYLKSSTESASELKDKDLFRIEQGVYTLSLYEPKEEGHYWVELLEGAKGFIYEGHCAIVRQ